MMAKFKILPLTLAAMFVLGGCVNNNILPENNNSEGTVISGDPVEADFAQTDTDMFSNRDKDTAYKSQPVTITLNGTSAACDSDSVTIDGSTVTITGEGTYLVTGTMDDGMILVNAGENDKVQIVLENASITSSTCAPLYILEADKVFVTLAEGSNNTLANGGTYTPIDDNNIDGVIYSKQDLTLNGTGSLTINGPAGHGIVCKDDLVVTGGTYLITTAGHGLNANDSFRICNGTLTIDAGKDGIHVENSEDTTLGYIYISGGNFHIEAEGDGISAGYFVQIENGTFTMVCGGGYENGTNNSSDNWGNMGGGPGNMGGGGRPGGRSSDDTSSGINGTTGTTEDSTSMKGIKANSSLLINGGTFTIDSADDSLHSNLSVYINNGTFTIASGDDGVHGEEELIVTGGTIDITHSYEGLEALTITINGGNISIQANDDGINAAGGTDNSGTGGRDTMFGGGFGGFGGGMSSGNGMITITDGYIFMYAKGDGIDSNGSLEISGGTIIVTGPTSGDTSILDYDREGVITGGTFIGVGAISMAQTFSDSTQGVMALQASGSGGSPITLTDANGRELLSYTPEFQFTCVILSCPEMTSGEEYTISIGTASGTFEAQ